MQLIIIIQAVLLPVLFMKKWQVSCEQHWQPNPRNNLSQNANLIQLCQTESTITWVLGRAYLGAEITLKWQQNECFMYMIVQVGYLIQAFGQNIDLLGCIPPIVIK